MEPFVLHGCINEWRALLWISKGLDDVIRHSSADEPLRIRFGSKKHCRGKVLFENESQFASVSKISDFVEWFLTKTPLKTDDGTEVDSSSCWGYFDYKYVFEVMKKDRISDIDWSVFGIHADPVDSTIWIGTPGAYTPCHIDSYGFNLHAQIHGCKRWVLFEPDEELKPTRWPYEESTIFSRVDVVGGDPLLEGLKIRTIVVSAGEVLFVPPGWWHSVQCVVPKGAVDNSVDALSISVNTWVQVPLFDRINRAGEAVTSSIMAMLQECRLVNGRGFCPSEGMLCLEDCNETLYRMIGELKNFHEEKDSATKDDSEGYLVGGPECKRHKSSTSFGEEKRSVLKEAVLDEKNAGELHSFLSRYKGQGKVAPIVSYETLLDEADRGPLEIFVEEEGSVSSRSKDDELRSIKRKFIDALTSPKVVQEIVSQMLSCD